MGRSSISSSLVSLLFIKFFHRNLYDFLRPIEAVIFMHMYTCKCWNILETIVSHPIFFHIKIIFFDIVNDIYPVELRRFKYVFAHRYR